jgi:hypothetical protein
MSILERDVLHNLDIDASLALMDWQFTEPDPDSRIIVQAYLPHMAEYGLHPMRDLVYVNGTGEQLIVGDIVLCPPTPKRRSTFEAIVVSLDGSQHPYKGPCKSIIRKVIRGE